jgi:hypothetical protein
LSSDALATELRVVTMSLRVTEDTYAALVAQARAEDRSVSAVARRMLEAAIARTRPGRRLK